MTNVPRRALRNIIAKHGREICADSRRCEGLLKDNCGAYRREISILINALEEHIPLDLMAAGNSVPRELLLNRLAKRLEDNLALTADAAIWAVESWALALNAISEAEIAERENKRAKSDSENETPINNRKFPPENTAQKQANTPKPPPNQPPIFAPPQPRQSTIPFNPPTAQTPVHPVPTGNSTLPQSNQGQTFDPVQVHPKKRSRKLRGCFIGCFLLLILLSILIVGVPYTFKVMRETQQPSKPVRVAAQ